MPSPKHEYVFVRIWRIEDTMRSTIVAVAVAMLGGSLFGCAAPRAATHGQRFEVVAVPLEIL
jgi:hypothetical protein